MEKRGNYIAGTAAEGKRTQNGPDHHEKSCRKGGTEKGGKKKTNKRVLFELVGN